MSVASAPAYVAPPPGAVRPSKAYQAAGAPPLSGGSVAASVSSYGGGLVPRSWDSNGPEGRAGGSPHGSHRIVVSGGGLSTLDAERLRQRGSWVRINLQRACVVCALLVQGGVVRRPASG